MKKNTVYKFKNIIFDLDGTLIDTSHGILSSLSQICLQNKINVKKPISNKIIGPPLRETLLNLTEINNENNLDYLIECFKLEYDSNGYKDTIIFENIDKVILNLYKNGVNLYIATNKRKEPTKKIINMLVWDKFFKGVYSIDSLEPHAKTKGELLSYMVKKHNLKNCIYIGDHLDDFLASKVANLPYMMVEWGFGDFKNKFHGEVTLNPYDLLHRLKV